MNKLKNLFIELGLFFHFTVDAFKYFIYNLKNPREMIKNIWDIGVKSISVVGLTGLFTGMILGLQLGDAMESIISGTAQYVGAGLSIAIIRELGPVLTSLIVVSRVCSSVTAKLGTMRVTEQIDALKTLSVNPMQYLVTPRVMAGMVALPILGSISSFLAIMGGFVMLTLVHKVGGSAFWEWAQLTLRTGYVFEALIKLVIFGGTLLLISTFYGFNTKGGAEGVGNATIKSVVVSSFMVILLDYLLGSIFIMVIF